LRTKDILGFGRASVLVWRSFGTQASGSDSGENHMVRRLAIFTVCALPAATAAAQEAATKPTRGEAGLYPRVKLQTTLGDIVLELDAEHAPLTTDNFIRYVEDGFYNGTIFHRVAKDFVIQGGGFMADMQRKVEGLRPGIRNEWRNGLKNVRGTVSMARMGGRPHSATSQFFINLKDNHMLDRPQRDGAGYAVFGRVVEGMDVVEKIRNVETIAHPALRRMGPVVPKEPVVIEKAALISPYARDKVSKRLAEIRNEFREKWPDEVKKLAEKIERETGKRIQMTDLGMGYVVLKEGSGPLPTLRNKLLTHYTGWLVDGTKFDSSYDRGQPLPVSLRGGVIRGWLDALATMRAGDQRKLIIPPSLGYGPRGNPPTIPPNAFLIFEVELVSIE